jgi:Flp pilus assembly protein TadG
MKILKKLPIIRRLATDDDQQSGVVLVLTALVMVVLMGMAAFAVDLGWLYYNQLNSRKAAEAAALAGVVHMPLPACADPVAGTDPYITAQDLAVAHGYINGGNATVTPSKGANCNQLTVTVDRTVNTFFMRVFGQDTISITEAATAEQLPPLQIGSDEPYLGEDPEIAGRDRDFFLAISGDDRTKGQGDAYAALSYDGSSLASEDNIEFRRPSYWYAVEVPEGSPTINQLLEIQIYDGPTHHRDGPAWDWLYDSGRNDGDETVTRFRVYAPDTTPGTWTDNPTLLCTYSFYGNGHPLYDTNAVDEWQTICNISNAAVGYYVVEVSSFGHTNMINGFSLRGKINGVATGLTSADLQVYGLGAMSLWQFDTGSNPVFKIARLDEIYAGSELIINLWDISDIGSSATINFNNPNAAAPINNLDCTMQTRNQTGGGASGYGADSGGSNCRLSFNSGDYNNRWIDFKFDIPGDYTCTGNDCWVYVSYSVGGSITDRTTWTASVNGQPIHLVP